MFGGLVAAACAVAIGPATARAGIVPVDGGGPNAQCTHGNCGTYSQSAGAPAASGGALHINPHSGQARTNGEAAYFTYGPPAWAHENVQGWQLRLDGISAAMGSNWRVVMCVPADSTSVCGGNPAVIWDGGPSMAYAVRDKAQAVRVALQYVGQTSGSVASSLIHLDATVRWVEVDNVPPAIDARLGDQPLTNGMLAGADATVELSASDNTEVAGGSITVNGATTPAPGGSGSVALRDGTHRVAVGACDIAQPANCAGGEATVNVDGTAPRVELLSPLAVDTLKPTVEVRATDPTVNGFRSGVTGARLQLGEKAVPAAVKPVEDRIQLTPADPLAEGRYPLDVLVGDRAGNSASLADLAQASGATPPELVVDTTPPQAAPVTPTPGAKVQREPLAITARLTDTVGITASTMLLDGREVQAALADSDLTWFYEEPCPGRHEVEATGRDAIGRAATARWTFTVQGALAGECARRVCAESKLVMSRALREARFDLKARRTALRKMRRAKTRADRVRYRASVRRWTKERRTDLRRYTTAKRRAKNACRIARRES